MMRQKLKQYFNRALAAGVIISELAWMGGPGGANDEWIEIQNNGTEEVSLSGWTLSWDARTILLGTSTLAAGEYRVFERTKDYVGALGNSGELLVLKNGNSEVQRLDASAGWPAGDNASKATMQWDPSMALGAGGWVTATATPKAGLRLVAPPAISAHASQEALAFVPPDSPRYFEIGRDRLTSPGVPLQFIARVRDERRALVSGVSVRWAFGDGSESNGQEVSHAYLFPGDYIVVASAFLGNDSLVARARVRVVSPEVLIPEANLSYITIQNRGAEELNLGGFSLVVGNAAFLIPTDTLLAGRGIIKFPATVTHLPSATGTSVAIRTSTGWTLAQFVWQTAPPKPGSSPIPTVIPIIQKAKVVFIPPRTQTPLVTSTPPVVVRTISRPASWWQRALRFFSGRSIM